MTPAVGPMTVTREAASLGEVLALRELLNEKITAVGHELQLLNDTGWQRIRDSDANFRALIQAIYEKLATMNEIRQQLNDQARTLASRESVDELRNRLEKAASRELVDELRERLDKFATREQSDSMLVEITALRDFKSNMQGRMWAMGALIFFGGLIVNLMLRFLFPGSPT